MTLTSFLITNFVDATLGLPSNANDSFSGLMQAQIVIDTNFGFGTDYGQLFIRMGMFTQIGDNSANSTNNTPPTLYFKYDSSTVVATQYDLQFVGTDFGKIRGNIQVNNNAGLVQFQLNLFFQATQDEIGYITNSLSNIRQLSFNNRTNTNKFQNAGNSVYANLKELSLACYFVLDSDNSTTFRKFSKQLQLGFYNPTSGGVHSGTFTVLRNAIPFTYLNGGVNNIEFAFTEVFTAAFIVVQIFNENAPNTPNLTYSANIQQTCRGGAAVPVLVFNQIADYEFLDQSVNPLSNGTYTSGLITFDINGALLATNGAYRIIVNVYADNGGGAFDGFSFISNQYQVLNPPEHDGRPESKFYWMTEKNLHGANSIISGHDKIGFIATFSGAATPNPLDYFNVTGKKFTTELQKIEVTLYEDVGGFRQIFLQKTLNNSNVGNRIPSFLGVTNIDISDGNFSQLEYDRFYYRASAPFDGGLYYQMRIRYEENVLNLATLDLSTLQYLPVPTANQNWIGRNLILEITATTRSNEAYTQYAFLEVRANSDVTIELQGTDNCIEISPNVFLCSPITQICKGDVIQLVAESTFNYTEPVLWSLDKVQYNHANARYSELGFNTWGPLQPFIKQDNDSIFEPRTGTTTDSITRIDTDNLVLGTQYRVACVMRDLSGVVNSSWATYNGVFIYSLNGLQFFYTNTDTVHDTGSYTGVLELPLLIECGSVGYITDPCELWNRKHCSSDIDFYLPICVADPSPVLPTFDLCEFEEVCNVVFDTINLTTTITDLEIETIFTSIIGIDKFVIQLYDPLYATWDTIETNLSPSLVNNFSYPLPIPATYLVRVLYYDLCNLNVPTFSPEFEIIIS